MNLAQRWGRVATGYGAAAMAAAVLGAAVAASPAVGVILLAFAAGAVLLWAPATYWALAAVIAAVAGRAFVYLGAPGAVAYLDIPLAWGALAAALIGNSTGREALPPMGRRLLFWLAWFVAAVLVSGLFASSAIQRILFFIALWGEPWAIIVALLIAQPTHPERRVLTRGLVGLVLIQVPLAWYQGVHSGFGSGGDKVQGTTVGSGAGADLVGALAIMGALWLASQRPLKPSRWFLVVLLTAIPVISGAKLVLLAVPATVLLASWGDRRYLFARVLIVGVSIYGLFFYSPGGSQYGKKELSNYQQSGKFVAARQIWSAMGGDLTKISVGLGPAMTFTHAAYLTVDPLVKAHSPVAPLHITPSAMARESLFTATAAEHTRNLRDVDSFHSEASSLIGLFGDLGALGVLAFAGLLGCVIKQLRRISTPMASAALYGLILITLLALAQDFWEESAVTVFLACMTGLGLTSSDDARQIRTPVPR